MKDAYASFTSLNLCT